MNRIIKFRAWDKELNTMHDWNYLSGWTPRDWGKSGVNVMQFTGLLDKNGKEIYEGDILQVAGNYKYEVAFILDDEDEEKVSGFGLLAPIQGRKFLIDSFAINNGEIIGNIYSNPELIRQTN